MRRDLLVAVLCILALLVVSVLSAHKETVPTDATRSSTDYSFGGYRGYYELLAREGVHVERFRSSHDALDTYTDTLVTAFPEGIFGINWSDAEHAALLAWVRNGGRLIDIGPTPRTASVNPKTETVLGEKTRGSSGPLRGYLGVACADAARSRHRAHRRAPRRARRYAPRRPRRHPGGALPARPR
jgi:hypothetical protein